jgi:ERCC4-related helicase
VRQLAQTNQHFRVLALSATPGPDIQTVQNVISNLHISHIEIRTEESIDIRPFTYAF